MKRHMILGAMIALTYQPIEVCGQTVDWFTGGNTSLNPVTSFSTKAGSSVFGDPAFPEGFAIERTEAMRGREMSLILRASLNSKLNDLIHHNSALGLLETFQLRAPKHEIARTLALQWRECYI
jgi:hypothetical protein